MSKTAKQINDGIFALATKFGRTDETRIDEDWLYSKMNDVRAELIVKDYLAFGILDQTWLSDLGLLTFHKVNKADNNTVSCDCDIAKTDFPQVISLKSKDGNLDLGIFSLVSACGKYQYYPRPMYRWSNTPPQHTNSLFKWYFRINTQLYISDTPTQLRAIAILHDPEDGVLNNSEPIASGSLVSGTVYLVKYYAITYNSVVYNPNSTFTANATTTFTGAGTVYLNSQVQSYRDTNPYPASGEMIRELELQILTKEFGIERDALVDVRNDSIDDAKKTV